MPRGREPRESREENRRNRREKPSQNVEARDVRQTSGDDAGESEIRDEQQPRAANAPAAAMTTNVRRSREAKAQTREEPVVQETEQEERVYKLCRVVNRASWHRKCALSPLSSSQLPRSCQKP
ncbi:hypothetical protein LNQ52_29110 [Klebsiella pneumoniae subsp. pneumoniae]|nr:hypothetical protein [Klebsiella pneumoniae subsp. pneumoniae]